ncbi:MAG: ABC transporter permease subunit [Fervidobacterium sp.]
MVKKENKVLTHIVLIIFTVVVLFPLVWVVSTSLRRDNAAFSTKLFSSRLTLQNYIDLIKPEKNGPRLVSDIDALVLMAPPHDKDTLEKAKEYFQKDIQMFKKYITETKNLKKNVDKNIETLKQYFIDNSEKLLQDYVNDLDNIASIINFEKPSRYVEVAAYELQNQGYDLSILQDINVSKGENGWYSMLGERKEKLAILEQEKKELDQEVEPLEKSQKIYQSQYLTTLKMINSFLLPQLKDYLLALGSANKLLDAAENSKVKVDSYPEEGPIKERFVATLGQIIDLKLNTEKFDDLKEIGNSLNEFQDLYNKILQRWENFSYKDQAPFVDFLNTIDLFTIKIAGTVNETVSLIEKLNTVTQKLLALQSEINNKKKILNTKLNEIQKLNEELAKAYSEISEALIYVKARLVMEQIKEVKTKVSKFKLPDQLQLLNLQSKKVFGIVSDLANTLPEGSKEQKAIRKIVSKIDWPGIAKDMFTNYELFSEEYESYMKALELYLADVEVQGPKFMPAAKSGIKVRPKSLGNLIDTVLSTYRNNVVPNMNVMSRKASELSDKLNVKEINTYLKGLDGAAYRIDQIWQRKPDHYMMRWILNSVIVALTVSIVITAVTALAAYPFSRMRFKGRKYGIMSLLLIQMFPAIMYMIAVYTFLAFAGKYIPGFGLNKLSGLIFAYLGGIAYNMYLIKGYYDTIPDSLEEAALIDGATRWQTFVKIVLPLASPILAVIVILTFMGTFNEFVLARIILQDVKQYTYAIGLYTFSTGPFETQWGLFTAAALIGMIPMVVLFLLMQKYIVGGLVKGAVKG